MPANRLGASFPPVGRVSAHRPDRAAVYAFAERGLIATWDREPKADDGNDARLVPKLPDGSLAQPYVSLTLPTTAGHERVIVLMRRTPVLEDGQRLEFFSDEGRVLARGGATTPDLDTLVDALTVGLDEKARARLLGGLASSGATALRLGGEPTFIALCGALARRPSPAPEGLGEVIALSEHLVLAVRPLDGGTTGPSREVIAIGPRGVRVSRVRQAVAGRNYLVVERHLVERGALLAVITPDGLRVRRVERGAGNAPPAMAWIGRLGADAPAFVGRIAPALASAARTEPKLRHILWEMQLRFPWERRSAIATGGPVAADVDLVISHGAAGVFLGGMLDDPHGMVESLWAVSAFGTARELKRPLHKVARRNDTAGDRKQGLAGRPCKTGFVTYLPGESDPWPSLQHRVEVRLASGTRIGLAAPPPPSSFAEARTAVLSSVSAQDVGPALLEQCIAPAAASLHAHHLRTERVDEMVTLGKPVDKPDLSVVIPLYRNLDFLRAQLGAFGTDPDFRTAELVYVLDSPEQRDAVVHLLEGLNMLHGLALKLVVMRENFGFAAASNAGARAARGKLLVMLNSDVIPVGAGWLSGLRAVMRKRGGPGAVGPKLLFEDGSLQHAGMYFATDHKDRWFNHHYYKGFPRGYAPANEPRSVPAVTGACMMLTAKLFDDLGGFSEDYIHGDFEDSDLCLKIRASGRDIRYQPSVELYHLEWRSKAHHRDVVAGVAGMYNAWLHAQRWSADMAAIMEVMGCASVPARTPAAEADTRDASAPRKRRGRRRSLAGS